MASSSHARMVRGLAGHPDIWHLSHLHAGEHEEARGSAGPEQAPTDEPLHAHYAGLPHAPAVGETVAAFLGSWQVSPTHARGLQNAAQGVFRMPRLEDRPDTQETDPAYRAHRHILRTLYEETQKEVGRRGGRTLYRPLVGGQRAAGQVKVAMAPLSSWTDRKDLAVRAARARAGTNGACALLMIVVTPQRLLATPHTGGMSLGSSPHEYVVIGRPTTGLLAPVGLHPDVAEKERDGMSDRSGDLPLIQPDATLENADWLRALHWGIHPSTADGLLEALGVADAKRSEQHAAVLHFLSLPAAAAMPQSVRSGLITRALVSPYDLLPPDEQEGEEGSAEDPAMEAARQQALSANDQDVPPER
jgi:hypothetical protein